MHLASLEALSRGLERQQAGCLEEAEREFQTVLAGDPENADALHLLGLVACGRGRPEQAVAYIGRAIAINPGAPFYHNNLGNALQALNRFADSVLCYQEALRRDPHYAQAYNNLGTAYHELDRDAEALACYQQALRLAPDYAEAFNNLGNSLQRMGHTRQAVDCYRQAIRLKPDYPDAHNNLGSTLLGLGEIGAAWSGYREALRLDPDEPKARWNRSLLLLLEGQFELGWQEYEWRWKKPDSPPRAFPQPLWDGSPLAGRTLLLHAEQGLGDTLQLVRYAPLVPRAGGGRVVLECQSRLAPLLAGFGGLDIVIAAGSELPDFEVHLPLLSLPRIFGTTLASIPAEVPYLHADPQRIDRWRARMPDDGRRKLGLCWAGSPAHKNNRNRSIPPRLLAPLAGIPGFAFFSLQKDAGGQGGPELIRLENDSTDILDLAAILANLDLVITVDTMVAHLAGALGRPVWNLLLQVPDWRWLLDRTDTPWYPTMRLFRQRRPGDWQGVIENIAEALRNESIR